MANEQYLLTQLLLSGFRAYLVPKAFDFGLKRSLAVFAPNGSGKSSIIDAIEFIFSEEGTLGRLGERTINNQAGPIALAHFLAEERKIESKVGIAFLKGSKKQEGTRTAVGKNRPRPTVATEVTSNCVISPVVRGHALRGFVEEQKAEKRYEDVVNWLRLGPFVHAQRNLRDLRKQTKAAAEDQSQFTRIDKTLHRATGGGITKWDYDQVLAFANSLLKPLDNTLLLKILDPADETLKTLESRVKEEENRIGLDGLRQILRTATSIYSEAESDSGLKFEGLLPELEEAAAALNSAITNEKDERETAANAVFAKVWDAAEPLFADGAPDLDTCPVCATPVAQTKAGSKEGIRINLAQHRDELTKYAAAKSQLDNATAQASKIRGNLIAAIRALVPLLNDKQSGLKDCLEQYQKSIASDQSAVALADSAAVKAALLAVLSTTQAEILEIESNQGENTYRKASNEIRQLIELTIERRQVENFQKELAKILEQLNSQSAFVSSEIRSHLQSLLDSLQDPINSIYAHIQGTDAVPIKLVLPSEDETNQQRLNLVIDFSKNRAGVQPSGYLSDSQIHSLALAFRLAAIKKFNPMVPLIALDDIVTSYDANHRRSISAMLAKEFSDSQIIITTHDERFFYYLKDQLGDKNWQYTRIIRLEKDFGPRFIDQRVTDEMIEQRWHEGQSAANEIRQAEEEWLLSISREFGVDVRIRTVERAYSYERSELADALARLLKSKGLTPPMVPGVNNRFLSSLQQGTIENFGSHFQDSPFGAGSIGDEKARWNEFIYFRSQFKCQKCGKLKFKRPNGIERPVCAADKCETQFEFGQVK